MWIRPLLALCEQAGPIGAGAAEVVAKELVDEIIDQIELSGPKSPFGDTLPDWLDWELGLENARVTLEICGPKVGVFFTWRELFCAKNSLYLDGKLHLPDSLPACSGGEGPPLTIPLVLRPNLAYLPVTNYFGSSFTGDPIAMARHYKFHWIALVACSSAGRVKVEVDLAGDDDEAALAAAREMSAKALAGE